MINVKYIVKDDGHPNPFVYMLKFPHPSLDTSHIMSDIDEIQGQVQLEDSLTRYIPDGDLVKNDQQFYRLYQKHNEIQDQMPDNRATQKAFQILLSHLDKINKRDSRLEKELTQIKSILAKIQQQLNE